MATELRGRQRKKKKKKNNPHYFHRGKLFSEAEINLAYKMSFLEMIFKKLHYEYSVS